MMLTKNDAIQRVKQRYPKRKATQIIDYDDHWWLIAAPEGNAVDFDSPYFAVNKKTGIVRTYSPMDDLEKFTEAIQERAINL